MKVSRIILIVLLFIAFFEIGIFSSYTIVTSEVPNVQELIDMQVNTISSIFSAENVGSVLIKDPDELNVSNKYELADAISEKAEVDGVNLDNMTVTTNQEPTGNFSVNVTAFGYSAPKSSSSSIVISGEPNYKIIASADAVNGVNGIEVNVNTIKIDSILKIYDADENSNVLTLDNGSNNKTNGSNYSSSSYDSGASGSSNTKSYNSGSSFSTGSSSERSSDGLEITINILNPLFSLI